MSPPFLTGLRELPDFLTRGDPALTFPHGKTHTPLHPKGVPNTPTRSQTPTRRASGWSIWRRGGLVPTRSTHPEPVEP